MPLPVVRTSLGYLGLVCVTLGNVRYEPFLFQLRKRRCRCPVRRDVGGLLQTSLKATGGRLSGPTQVLFKLRGTARCNTTRRVQVGLLGYWYSSPSWLDRLCSLTYWTSRPFRCLLGLRCHWRFLRGRCTWKRWDRRQRRPRNSPRVEKRHGSPRRYSGRCRWHRRCCCGCRCRRRWFGLRPRPVIMEGCLSLCR